MDSRVILSGRSGLVERGRETSLNERAQKRTCGKAGCNCEHSQNGDPEPEKSPQTLVDAANGEEIDCRSNRIEDDLSDQSSNPMNRTASSTLLRFDTTAFAGKSPSGQPIATQIMMT